MSDYTKTTNFAIKDTLPEEDPNKTVSGAEHDVEYNNIQTAVNSKYDAADRNVANGIAGLDATALIDPQFLPGATTTSQGVLETATDAEAIGTSGSKILTPSNLSANSGAVRDLLALPDPGADRIFFWDDSINAGTWLTLGAELVISGTTLSVGTLDNASVPQSAVTQHQAALSITESQISDFGTYISPGDTVASLTITALTSPTSTITTLNIGNADTSVTRDSAGKIAVEGRSVFMHDDAALSSARVFFSTAAPTTEGSDGDIWLQYE